MDQTLTEYTFYRGRVALYAVLRAMGIGAGDEVATQAFTCVAVPEGIMACGSTPLYVDVGASSFTMDPDDLEKKLTPKTKAVVVQHTYGIPADMDKISAVASSRNLPIIEDCCHTLASRYKGKTVGEIGQASFYSFEWGKPIVAGIGGSARVNDPIIRAKLADEYDRYSFPRRKKVYRIQLQYYVFKMLYRPCLYWPVRSLFHGLGALGVAASNYNPVGNGQIADDFGQRMALPLQRRLKRKLKAFEQQTEHSRWVVSEYRSRIHSDVVSHPVWGERIDPVFARYPMLTKDKLSLLKQARSANVEVAEWYATPVHPLSQQQLDLVGYRLGSCPNAERQCAVVVSLPTHIAVQDKDIDRIIRLLNRP